MSEEAIWQLILIGSVVLTSFCSGMIFGAYLISRRDEKILEYFRDEVLTDEQNSDILKKNLAEEIFVNNRK
tara:strand:+ start:241 stop:453 length:213 start_codon:yes stop_codon:yes gene_type:complete